MLNLPLIMLLMIVLYNLNSPVSSIMILIMMTLLIGLTIFNMTYSLWLPIIIFLMMVGGMLILFIYMISITPNKKSLNFSMIKTIKSTFFFMIMSLIFHKNMEMLPTYKPILIFSMMDKPFFMIFSISYLFMFLLILTLIFKKKSGPLRSM